MFALTGYLVLDRHETMSVMLLVLLEALDADRIATLVGSVTDYAGYLVVALLPEAMAVIGEDYLSITNM